MTIDWGLYDPERVVNTSLGLSDLMDFKGDTTFIGVEVPNMSRKSWTLREGPDGNSTIVKEKSFGLCKRLNKLTN